MVQEKRAMVSSEKSGETYVYYNPNDRNEYYLIENRSQTGWDGGLRGSGLLVTHVHYNAQDWQNNRVNASAYGKTGMTIVCADGSASLKTLADQMGDVFPYFGENGTVDSFENSKAVRTLIPRTSKTKARIHHRAHCS